MIRRILVATRSISTKMSARDQKIVSYPISNTKPFLSSIAEYERWLDPDVAFDSEKLSPAGRVEPIKGYATEFSTGKFAARNPAISKSHFRLPYNSKLKISSLGIGTYIGAPDNDTDFLMYNAVKESVLSGGINIIDTGIPHVSICA